MFTQEAIADGPHGATCHSNMSDMTDGRTGGHMMTANTALAQRCGTNDIQGGQACENDTNQQSFPSCSNSYTKVSAVSGSLQHNMPLYSCRKSPA